MPQNNIEIRSEEVQEIIGFIPHWLVRSGITVVFSIVMILFTGSFFFKYPDVIVAKATLSGNTPPAHLKARVNGKITQIFVTNKQKVQENQVLAIVENTCNYADFLSLKKITESVSHQSMTDGVAWSDTVDTMRLGELQNYYTSYQKQLKDFQYFTEIDYHHKKIESINKQIADYQVSISNLEKQNMLSQKDLKLQGKQFARDSILYKNAVISADEYEKSEAQYLQKKLSHESAKNTISNTRIQISSLEQSILDLELQYQEQKEQKRLNLSESLEQLKAQMQNWEQTYLIKSPFAGKIELSKIWSTNQNIVAGEVVCTILPLKAKQPIVDINISSNRKNTAKQLRTVFNTNENKIQARALLPILGAGKVRVGQNVNLKLSGFPYQQYGMLKGKISEIADVTDGENYTVKIELTNSMQTNYNIKIPFKQNMQASAEILTEELPLIARLFNPIKSLFKQ